MSDAVPGSQADIAGANLIATPDQVATALDKIAADIATVLSDRQPVLLAMMIGGLYPAVWLSQRLAFPHQIDYLHATRYRGALAGGRLAWKVPPPVVIRDRSVLLIDDILDHGDTMLAARQACLEEGAREVLTAVLVRKRHEPAISNTEADFVGLVVPDRYVFGCGMDVREYWRQLSGIHALPAGAEKP